MREPVKRTQIQDYLAARARANRYMRDSSPPLSKKGLAAQLKLEQSAFNKFLNGTIFVDRDGQNLTATCLDEDPIFLRAKWTGKRLCRFIERVETECWRLGIANRPNPNIKSAARSEAEQLRVSKHYQFVKDITDSADLSLASAFLFWEVGSQEAVDARQHLRPSMCVNALVGLGDLVDRKTHGRLMTSEFLGTDQQSRLDTTVSAVRTLIAAVHSITGDPCGDAVDTKNYECYHKAHGYGGYDLYFLGTTLESEDIQVEGVDRLLKSIVTDHHSNDGHVANAATVIESSLESKHSLGRDWAGAFRELVDQRLAADSRDPACHRLLNMKIPRLRNLFRASLFTHPYFQHGLPTSSQRADRRQASTVEEIR